MKSFRIGALCMFISILAVLTLPSLSAASDTSSQEKRAVPASPDSSSSSYASSSLFPGLDKSFISALSIATPERSFAFCCENADDVSVNGNQADEEIFGTLISQIQGLPVDAQHPFTPDTAPVLVLSVLTRDGVQHTARFYSDKSAARVQISSGPGDAPVYHSTDTWRIGTLMMTCEGTRIQDASGNETPAGVTP